jgi:protein required for attachment to host cells
MLHPLKKCFLIADGGRARFVMPGADDALRTHQAIESASLHKKSHDLGTDQPGRAFESASVTRHAIAPRTDPHELEKLKFAQLVAERMTAAVADGDVGEYVVVAPSHILAEITGALDAATMARITGTLAKDLVNVPDHELLPHLKDLGAVPPRRA